MTRPDHPSEGVPDAFDAHDDFDADPTGMRDLLRSLPDPGPMPDDLVARITAALHDESARTASALDEPDHHEPPYGVVTPIAPRRMPLWQRLGAAAATVLVLGGGGALVLGNLRGGSDNVASSVVDSSGSRVDGSSTDGSSADDSASGPLANAVPESGSSPAEPSTTGPDEGGIAQGDTGTRVLVTGAAYRSADLATQARDLVASTATPLPPLASESPGLGPITTPLGLRDCARGLDLPGDATLVLDIATVDGRPAAVLVATSAGGSTAYAVERTCSAADPHRIAGPVPLR
ncbi:hypothetical protein ACQP1U_18750 [Actinomycetota bacterium]